MHEEGVIAPGSAAPDPDGAPAGVMPAPGHESVGVTHPRWGARADGWPLPRLVVLAAVAVAILWLARGIVGPFVVAAVLAYAFSPLVDAAARRTGWPRSVIAAGGYVASLAALAVLFAVLAGRIADELNVLASSGPDAIATALKDLLGRDTLDIGGTHVSVTELSREIQAGVAGLFSTPGDAIHVATVGAETAGQVVLALIVTFYFLLDGPRFLAFALGFVPAERRPRTVTVFRRIHETLGRWLRGQLFLVALVAVVVYLILGPVLHVPYALSLAAMTGALEIIPFVGPVIATAIAATVAFGHGGSGLAIVVIVVYVVLREVEDQVVMPVVIGRAVHLHPVVTIFAVLVGLSAWGVLGGLLAVPIAAALNVVLHELYPDQVRAAHVTAAVAARED